MKHHVVGHLLFRPLGMMVWERLMFYNSSLFFFFFHRKISEVPQPIATKFCHVVGSAFSLQLPGSSYPTGNGGPPNNFFEWGVKYWFKM